jgi:hypothetical protein
LATCSPESNCKNFPILTLKFLPTTFITSSYTSNLTQKLPSAYKMFTP